MIREVGDNEEDMGCAYGRSLVVDGGNGDTQLDKVEEGAAGVGASTEVEGGCRFRSDRV